MKKEYGDYIQDILDSINDAVSFTSGMTFDSFSNDKKTANAVIRSIEVMGEAAKNVPETLRKKYPTVPWKQMAGMRDKLIHEYSGVDLETVWKTATEDLPSIKPIILNVLENI
ncbi:MAG: hypothetical protein COV46_02235 [Deltaproteobacteria bacterium CG11_big_fil_rev_8_21_14_0_20_49_13]|nr:MAG: hypothetical protein COV46_02235 [Deltaproteobacteria bacterium CG11_big_fil_rev_8_21_14_0_20_49_13]